MKRKHSKLRIEALEDRINPTPFPLQGSVQAGGAIWTIANNFFPIAPGIQGFGIISANLNGPPARTDAYDGAFLLTVNGTTFQDPTGTVDLTGTTLTTNSEVIDGLTTSVQYFFDPNSPTVRAIYNFTNPSASPITATASVESNLGSDDFTFIEGSSSGSASFSASDRWFVSDDGNPDGDPVLTFVRFGPGTVQMPSATPEIPGTGDPGDTNDLFFDEYDLTVPAGATRSLMVFGQMSQDVPTADASAATFNSISTVYSAGLLAGLSAQQESQIVNWQFPAITSAASTTLTATEPGPAFTVTTTSPETAAISETGALPTGVSFVDNGNGTATLNGTPAAGTEGDYPITITAATGSGPAATQAFTLTVKPPIILTSFSVSAPASTTAGSPTSFTVTALDQYGDPDPNFTGTVHLTGSDAGSGAAVPADYTFLASEDGVHTFTGGATFVTAGDQTLTATDTANSKIDGTADITVDAAAASHLSVSAPANATAGAPFNVTITALDPYGNTDTNYAGTVDFSSSDSGPGTSLPADYTFVSSDKGVHTFTDGVTLVTAGTQTVAALDDNIGLVASADVTVIAAAATHFGLSAPASTTAGNTFDFTLTALDPYGNTDTNYAGTAHFTSTDSSATLPADSTLTDGTGMFSATLDTAGNQTIAAADTADGTIDGSALVDVKAAAATQFSVSAPASATAGTAFAFTVTALDPFGNVATSYAGTVGFASSDGSATLPPKSPLAAGVGTFSATLRTAGDQTITATDTADSSITGTTDPIAVSAAAASHFSISAPTSTMAGTAFSITVTALDPFGNIAAAYAGTAHFTSSDASALLPANSTLSGGTGTFTAMLKTANTQTITAADIVNSSIDGTASIKVLAAATAKFVLSAPASVTFGTAFTYTVAAEDAFGNATPAYAGTLHFTSTDAHATLPADSTLANGTGTFSATLFSTGSQTITATDTASSSLAGTSNAILIINAPATHFAISAPANVTAGTAFTFTVTALDAFNNTASTYSGSLHFTTSTILSALPGTVTLTGGVGTFAATLFTAGAQTLTATDASAVTGTTSLAVAIVGRYAVGSGPGVSSTVVVYDSTTGAIKFMLKPFEASFLGGVHVTTADVNGDGTDDIIVGAGTGGGPRVMVFDGKTGRQLPGAIGNFFAYSSNFRDGVNVAAGDINGDGYADVVTGAALGGGPQVTEFSGKTGSVLRSFFAYGTTERGGVSVAVGDVDGDGTPDIVTGAGVGDKPLVEVYSGKTGAIIRSLLAFNPQFEFDANYTGGVRVAVGDVNGDGYADIIAGGGSGGTPQVKVFSGQDTTIALYNFLAYDGGFTGGVNVAAADVNQDGTVDIVTGAGNGGGPQIKEFSGETGLLINTDFPLDPSLRGGVFVGGDGVSAAIHRLQTD